LKPHQIKSPGPIVSSDGNSEVICKEGSRQNAKGQPLG
jgi:hypothetical protein